MTEHGTPTTFEFGKRLQSGSIAILFAIAGAFILRLTTLSIGPRVGITFFVFAILDSLIYERLSNSRYSAAQWIKTIGLALVASLSMSLIARH